MDATPDTVASILSLLPSPITAEAFARAYYIADPDETPGSLSRRGHSCLAPLVRKGTVHRIGNGGPPFDLFVAADAPAATVQSAQATPATPPELRVRPGTRVVEQVEHRAVGRLAPEQPLEGKIAREGNKMVRTRTVREEVCEIPPEMLAQLPPEAPAAPAAPQQVPVSEIAAIGSMLYELLSLPLDAATRPTKIGEVHARMLANSQLPPPPGYEPAMRMQRQMLDQLAAMQPQPPLQLQPQQTAPPTIDPMAMMQAAFQLFQEMQAAAQPPDPEPTYRAPYRPFGVGGPSGYQPPPARPKSAAEQFRENVTSVRAIATDLHDLGVWTDRSPPEVDEPEEEHRSPIQVIDTGGSKLVVGRDGSGRPLETVIANLTPIMKWLGEMREATQRAREPQRPQLPPAPVEPQQAAPPAEAPAVADPVPHANGSAPQRRTWSMPTIPGSPA